MGDKWATAATRPCPSGTPSGASDTYKIIPDATNLTPEGFSQIRYRAPPPSPTSFGGQIACSDTLPRRGLAPEAIFTATATTPQHNIPNQRPLGNVTIRVRSLVGKTPIRVLAGNTHIR